MSCTRLNPGITSGGVTAGQSDVSVGTNNWWHKYGRIVVACANFKDSTPSGGAAILNGYPPPADTVPVSVTGDSSGSRAYLYTNGNLYWEYNTSFPNTWVNSTFAYLSAQ